MQGFTGKRARQRTDYFDISYQVEGRGLVDLVVSDLKDVKCLRGRSKRRHSTRYSISGEISETIFLTLLCSFQTILDART